MGGKYKYYETGLEIADICEVRPGYMAYGFDSLKHQADVDLQSLQHQCFSIIGSERTICCRAIGLSEVDLIEDDASSQGQPTAENLARSFVRGLRLYMQMPPSIWGRWSAT